MKRKIFFILGSVCIIAVGSFLVFYLGCSLKIESSLRGLENEIETKAKSGGFDYSFLVEDLRWLGPQVAFGPDKQFPAASLIKLPILAAGLRAVRDKKVNLEQKVVITKKDITGGSGQLKKEKLPITVSYQELLALMTSTSDNTAANKLIDILGFDYINDTSRELGLASTVLARKIMDFSLRRQGIENYISSRDTAKILKLIYQGNLINKNLSRLALEFLKNQKVSDRLPRYLPQEIIVANKTGLERGVVHDAGIIFAPGGDYIICVLVKNTRTYPKAKKFIAEVSLLTYNLYQD